MVDHILRWSNWASGCRKSLSNTLSSAGSNGRFAHHAGVRLASTAGKSRADGRRADRPRKKRHTAKARRPPAEFEREQRRRDAERRKEGRPGRRRAPGARSWSRRRRLRSTRPKASTRSVPNPLRRNGRRLRSGFRLKRPGGREKAKLSAGCAAREIRPGGRPELTRVVRLVCPEPHAPALRTKV